MFEEKALLFFHAVTPVHMGAGTALGAVDNPIQREVHTGHPLLAGSGLKGALRDLVEAQKGDLAERLFGPKKEGSDHAGAVSLGDAQLVLFPVRSAKRAYLYATSLTCLARIRRMAEIAGIPDLPDLPSEPKPGEALCASKEPFVALAGQERVVLEALDYGAKEDAILQAWARWIGENGFPEKGFDHFKKKVTKDTVLLSEEAFQHFVQNATLVEAHVRIDDESGTADDGGLFYTENLPPESLLAGLLMASRERPSRQNGKRTIFSARQVLDELRPFLSGAFVQAGGDATSGRGGLVIRFLEGGKSHGQNA